MSDFGNEEGAICWRDGCQGVVAFKPAENCSCHISPPCSGCTSNPLHCPSCRWEDDPDTFVMNDYTIKHPPGKDAYEWWEPRPLDPRTIDWHSRSHTSASMIKEGVYPEAATREEVEKLVKGTFGGRFASFANGRFKYIAYTD